MTRARTMEEYREMVRQALLEVRELEAAAEFGEMAEVDTLTPPLRRTLETLAAQMEDGTYQFGGAALDFVPLVEAYDVDVLPFRHLLLRLNETHTEGLDESAVGPEV